MVIKREFSTVFNNLKRYRLSFVRFLIVIAVVLSFSWLPMSAQSPEDEWKTFRKAFPLHIQTVAVSRPYSNSTRTLIISEPPPHVTIAKVKEIQQNWFRDIRIMKHRIGYDGEVKDLVALIPDDGQLSQVISRLNRLLFHTSYKSHALLLPYQRRSKPQKIELKIGAEEVRGWLLDSAARFQSVTGGQELTLNNIRGSSTTHVYLSKNPGLVLWWIPKGTKLDQYPGKVRQFALDSDLIVGAQIFKEGLLIVARERIAPLDILPPLRVETIILLASVDRQELGQSYERNHPLAGRYAPKKDWAPIYLSPELRNTEYGSLLNITDQILKGWSNCGYISYFNFRYPEPPRWPFSKPLSLKLGLDELIFNWNTSGAGYTIGTGMDETYALNRTGTLPVSYIPGGDQAALKAPDSMKIRALRHAENEVYEYFAKLQDPYLVRVVQYAALYQIFRRAPVVVTKPLASKRQPEEHLEALMRGLLQQIRDADKDKLIELAESIAQKYRKYGNELDISPDALNIGISLAVVQLHKMLQGASSDDLNKLVTILKLPPSFLQEKLKDLPGDFSSFYMATRIVLPTLAASQKIFQKYVKRAISSSEYRWIRTPTVVLSSVRSLMKSYTGGHNLNSKISPFRLNYSVPVGKVETRVKDGKLVILINPADTAKISKVVRTAGKNLADPKQLVSRLNEKLGKISPPPVRSMHEALGRQPSMGTDINRLPRGVAFSPESGNGFRHFNSGWFISNEPPKPIMLADFRVARSLHERSITIRRFKDGIIHVMNRAKKGLVKAYTLEDAIDSTVNLMRTESGNSTPVHIHLAGFSEAEAAGIIHSARVRTSRVSRVRIEGRTHVHNEPIKLESFNENVSRNYDFKKAKLHANDSYDRTGSHFTIIVPPRQGSKIEKNGKITIKFGNWVKNTYSRLKTLSIEKIKEILTGKKDRALENLRILNDIQRELRILIKKELGIKDKKRSLDFKIKFETNMGVILIGKLEQNDKFRTCYAG